MCPKRRSSIQQFSSTPELFFQLFRCGQILGEAMLLEEGIRLESIETKRERKLVPAQLVLPLKLDNHRFFHLCIEVRNLSAETLLDFGR